MAAAFVASAGPPGWKLGRWSQISPTIWQEQKLDNPKMVHQFQVLGGTNVPGSTTIRLKMKDQSTEVLLLDSTVQIFSNAGYMGEYCGQWQGGSPPAPQRGAANLQQTSLPAGYTPSPATQPSRQAPVRRSPAPAEQEQDSLQQTSLPAGYTPGPATQPSRQAPIHRAQDAAAERKEMRGKVAQGPGAPQAAAAPLVQAGSMVTATSSPDKVPDSLDKFVQQAPKDKSPDKVQKLCDAAKIGDVESVNRLLESGIDPDGAARDGKTPLMAAAGGGHLRVVEALLAAGADANLGKGPDTPLTIAFQKGNQDVLKALFGASFSALGTMVGKSSSLGDISSYDQAGYGVEEVPDSAIDNLRDVTKMLAAVKPRDGGQYGGGYAKDIGSFDRAESMREASVKVRMRTMVRDPR